MLYNLFESNRFVSCEIDRNIYLDIIRLKRYEQNAGKEPVMKSFLIESMFVSFVVSVILSLIMAEVFPDNQSLNTWQIILLVLFCLIFVYGITVFIIWIILSIRKKRIIKYFNNIIKKHWNDYKEQLGIPDNALCVDIGVREEGIYIIDSAFIWNDLTNVHISFKNKDYVIERDYFITISEDDRKIESNYDRDLFYKTYQILINYKEIDEYELLIPKYEYEKNQEFYNSLFMNKQNV